MSLSGLMVLLLSVPAVWGHGRLIDPPSRSSMWRYGFQNTAHNYNDNQLYCGGVQVQYEKNGGKCGVCGDPWNGPRDNEPPGRYAKGIIVRKYKPGQVITVVIELTANHKGWMEFKICPNDDPRQTVTQQCMDRHVLPLAETNSPRYYVPKENGYSKIKLNLILPSNVKCKDCVLQWRYNAGNSWGTDPITGRGCIGCGNQEQFYGCADIAIGYDDIDIPPHNLLPADMEDDDDHDKTKTPLHPDWEWTAPPPIPDTDRDGDWETAERHTHHKDENMFNFKPMLNNGMSPCMCICKKGPVKMNGGHQNSLQVKFFEGMEGGDNQVCMCMCQNSATNTDRSSVLTVCALVVACLYNYFFSRRWHD